MFLRSVTLKHYRNYEEIELATDKMVNIFVGQNAQGKTNLLESIFVLALTKSHRTRQDKELIRWNADSALIQGTVDKRYGQVDLSLSISRQGKKAKINGLEQSRLSRFVGTMNVVMFAPEDLDIVKGSPSVRRRFLDMEMGQVMPAFLHEAGQYQKVLAQRNNLIKQSSGGRGPNPALLQVLNEQLAEYGIKMMKKRQSFIRKLQAWAEQIHSGITDGRERIEIRYAPSFDMPESEDDAVLLDQFMLKLSQTKEQEIRRGATLVGPHRDDMTFFINGHDVQTYGSQGQQRTTALSLKLAELELMREEVGEYPILLLDDVLSELDRHRQTQLIATFQNKVQTFITTTGLESVNLDKVRDAAVFQVDGGRIGR